MGTSRIEIELVDAQVLAPSVRLLRFRSRGEAISYRAGQWIKLYLAGGIDRDYSIASAPDPARAHEVEIAVTRVEQGPGSGLLHDLPIGARLEASGPFGFFVREPEHAALPAIFVGTGTGLAPLRAMLQEEVGAPGPPLILLFGCRFEADILWRSELERAAAEHPRFRYEVTLSSPSASWSGRSGYVQAHLPELAGPLVPAHVYVCGLTRMVQRVRAVAKELGLERKLIHSERYDAPAG